MARAAAGVDPRFLVSGVSADDRGRIEASPARAEARTRTTSTPEALEGVPRATRRPRGHPALELQVRPLNGEARVRLRLGEVKQALELLTRSSSMAEDPIFSDVDRAEILYRLGACRVELSSIQTAISLFNEALALAERSELPCDRFCGEIFGARSRCYRRQRDFEAAREDLERALELAEALDDRVRSHACTSTHRSSPSARASGCLHAVRRAGEGTVRGDRRPQRGRQAAEQPRRAQLPARQARGGSRAAQRVVPRPARVRHREGCGLGSLFARAGEPPDRPDRAGGGAGAAGTQAPRRPRRRGRRDRKRAARPRALADGAGPPRRSSAGLRGGRAQLRPAFLSKPSCGRVDRQGRPCGAAWSGPVAAQLYRRAAEALQDFRF